MRHWNTLDLRNHRCLDGAFATELERRRVSVGGPLWSARALREAPEAVLAVHRAYLDAGADVLSTGSYQASSLGLAAAGFAPAEAQEAAAGLLRVSVSLAARARAEAGRPGVLIAASLGPYGAALANGAEFHGEYGFGSDAEQHRALVHFHAERIAVLAETEADLLAFETLPSLAEARAIAEALQAWPTVGAWLSFTCRDGAHTAHGEPLRACAAIADAVPQIVAIGVNCIAPALVASLLAEVRAATEKPIVVYPNSGEGWDAERHRWIEMPDIAEAAGYEALARRWFQAGAQLIGGCCRTGPAHTRAVRAALEVRKDDAAERSC